MFYLPREIRGFLGRARPFLGQITLYLGAVLIVSLLSLIDPLIIKWIIDDILPWQQLDLLIFAVAAFFVANLTREILQQAAHVTDIYLGQRITLGIRLHLLGHLQKLSSDFFDSRKTGELLFRVDQDVSIIEELGGQTIASVLRVLVTFVLTIAIMLALNWQLTLGVLLFLPGFLVVRHLGTRRLRRELDASQVLRGKQSGLLEEQLSSIRQTQLLGQERKERRRLFAVARRSLSARMRVQYVDFGMRIPTHAINAMMTCVIFGFGGYQVLNGNFTVGGIIAFQAYYSRLFSPLYTVIDKYTRFQKIRISMARVLELLDEVPAVVEKPSAVPLPADGPLAVDFKEVGFSYQNEKPVLRGLNIKIKGGEKVAIVGESGSGKSTVASLLARQYDPTGGTVLVDDVDLLEVQLRSLRHRVVLVPQDPILFDLTFRENLSYGHPKATDRELWRAVEVAQLEDVLADLPDGWEEKIGRRGMKLSGGQRQRLAMARALLRDPGLLVLDESTSALDSTTERKLLEGLTEFVEDRTVVLIAHRMTSVLWADRILVMADGRVAEEGTHRELYRQNGLYRRLFDEHRAEIGDLGTDVESAPAPEKILLSA
ncbi:MAG: ABC transporter ATP-binding protein [Acidobacteriota bacterium]